MIIFIYGEDTYRLKEKTREIVEEYRKVHKNGLSLKFVDFSKDESDIDSLKNDMRQVSMFKEKKLIVIGNPFLNIDIEKKVLEEAKNYAKSSDLFLFFNEGEVKKSSSLFKFLVKNAKCQEFSLLKGLKLKNWAEKQFILFKSKVNPIALQKLLFYTGNDLWRLNNEIKKLSSFKLKSEVNPDDVGLLVRANIETDIFKTIDALAQKDKKTALSLLHRHLSKGDSPLYILSMISYQFRNLIVVKDLIERGNPYNLIVKKSGLHPYVVKKNYYQAPLFTTSELKKIYQKIFKADLDIKTGRINPVIALDILISEI